jgi:putative endopeptidase
MKLIRIQTAAVLMLSLSVAANANDGKKSNDKPKEKIKYIDKANMDPSVKPGDNFYQYANGGWLKKNPVPNSKTRWGSFDVLREESSNRLRTLLEAASTANNKDRPTQMIGDFYKSGMDSATIEARGYQPIKADLEKVSSIRSTQALLEEMTSLRVRSVAAPLISAFVGQDRKNVTQYITQLGQGGTSMGDRDYYLKDDARSTAIRNAYKEYVNTLFKLVGEDAATAAKSQDAVLRIETALAKAQYSRLETRDPYKTYNKYAIKDLQNLTPGLNWKDLLNKLQIPVTGTDSILVSNPNFLKTVDVLLSAVSLDDWKSYVRWNIIKNAASYLSSDFVNANFKYNQVITGQKEQTPRWQRISGQIDGSLGDLLGQVYVQKYFKPEAKERMLGLVNNLQETFRGRINSLDWMSDETKGRALEKLNSFSKKIAYPDNWKTYNGVTISGNDFLGNVRNVGQWGYKEMVSRLGKPIDKTEWGMTPPTINAYYNPVNNEIAFPAGILQFPFFDFGADDAVNYGGIGAVIGHEMTHGFDDQGRQYAADGNLKDWWKKDDADKFKKRADEVVAQYNALTVLDTLHVDGRLTLGENIADLGGLTMALEAFKKTKEYQENKKIDGFTPLQRFFLSWAQVWRNNALPETQANLIKTDSHSPGVHRANGPITNIDDWYKAFDVKEGDKLYKPEDKRTKIW